MWTICARSRSSIPNEHDFAKTGMGDVIHFGDISQSNDPVGREIPQIEAISDKVKIRPSAVKYPNFGKLHFL